MTNQRFVRAIVLVSMLSSAACGGGGGLESQSHLAPSGVDDWSGVYAIDGEPWSDGCGQRVVLAARRFEIDLSLGTLYADVVERTYQARFEGEKLIAEGRFDSSALCPGSTLYERWELTQVASGLLTGELISTWALPPSCEHACSVRFALRASR